MARRPPAQVSNRKILQKALARYQEGRLDEASTLCRKILSQMPRDPNALHLMGVVQLMNGARDEAAELLRRAAEADVHNAEIHSNLGSALRACGQWEAAEESYRRAIEMKPAHAQAHYNLANLLRQQRRLNQAILEYTRAGELDPGYADAFNNLGLTYMMQGDHENAITAYENAVKAAPAHAEAGRNLANLLRLTGRLADCLTRLDSHLQHHSDDADSTNLRGVVLSELGRHDEAVSSFRKALELAPDFADAMVNLGNGLCQLHRPGEALPLFESAVELDPACVDTIANYGHALRQLGQNEKAIDAYEQGLSFDPDHLEASFGAASANLSLGRYEQGWQHYLERQSLRPIKRTFHRTPLAQDLAGKRVLVEKDQGLGDELFFVRFLPNLRERMPWTAYRPDSRLAAMLERAQIANQIASDDEDADSFDMKLSIADLPYLLGMGDTSPIPEPIPIPPLADRLETVKGRLQALGPAPYIALTWRAGTPGVDRLQFKEAPLDQLARAISGFTGTVLCVQREPLSGETGRLAADLGMPVHDLSPMNDDLEDMLALMSLVDEYVCVSNTNVHLRASTGLSSRILIPNPPEFRWMTQGPESPWFKGTKLYRQGVDGDWITAFAALRDDLFPTA